MAHYADYVVWHAHAKATRVHLGHRSPASHNDGLASTSMRSSLVTSLLIASLASGLAAQQPGVPAAIYTDLPGDSAHPARMEVLHIPSGGVKINGVAYV